MPKDLMTSNQVPVPESLLNQPWIGGYFAIKFLNPGITNLGIKSCS